MSERAGRQSRRSRMGEWKMTVCGALRPAAGFAQQLRLVPASDDPLTDDRAPVEWMTDQMIVRYAADAPSADNP